MSAFEHANAEENLRKVFAGSNITNFATDNSSGGLAARERATGKFRWHNTINGESFFSPGWAEPAYARRWNDLESATPPSRSAQEIHLHNKTILDGRVVARNTVKHIVGQGNKAASGGRLTDKALTRPITI